MGILDRMMNRQATSSLELTSSIPAPVDAPVIQRMKQSAEYIMASVKGVEGAQNPIYKRLLGEMLNEVKEMPPEFLEIYLGRIGQIFLWTANGEGDFPFPEMGE